MSLPTEVDFALIRIGNGATPTEAFPVACGIQDVTINQTVNSSDHFVRDCAAPGSVPFRKTKVSGKQLDITGTGLSNADMIETFNGALGALKNYQVELYAEDGTDTGTLLGTYAGNFRMTANNLTTSREGNASGEVTLASHGEWTYEAA